MIGDFYAEDLTYLPFECCESCLCAMCFHYPGRCRYCYFCYQLNLNGLKFCTDFVPNMLDRQLREWFNQERVIKDPYNDVENFPFK